MNSMNVFFFSSSIGSAQNFGGKIVICNMKFNGPICGLLKGSIICPKYFPASPQNDGIFFFLALFMLYQTSKLWLVNSMFQTTI